jgi:hypothetical protein
VRCVKDLDEVKHTSSRGECNKTVFILKDLKQSTELLAKLEAEVAADEVAPAAKRRRADLSPVPPGPAAVHPTAAPAARPAAESKTATSSKMLMAHHEMVADKQQEYYAHFIRDGNQECFKNLFSENMPVVFLLLVDYWAKISIGKAGGPATCEGDSKGPFGER